MKNRCQHYTLILLDILLMSAESDLQRIKQSKIKQSIDMVKTESLRQKVAIRSPEPMQAARIGLVPVMLSLYDKIIPELRTSLQAFYDQFSSALDTDGLEIVTSEIVSNDQQMRQACHQLEAKNHVDLLLVTHLCYAPSGQIAPALLACNLPIILWPAQPMSKLVAKEYSSQTCMMNHAVHGTMDLANVLCRKGKIYGVLHGHWQNDKFQQKLRQWANAGRVIRTMKGSNPIVLGNRFKDMLDLRLDNELFINELNVKSQSVSVDEFACLVKDVANDQVLNRVREYQAKFNVKKDLESIHIQKAARHELALRQLLANYDSSAFGINFVDVCNHSDVADSLHVGASILMGEGNGYGGEGDWETAMFAYGLQKVLGSDQVSFTEIFTPGYDDNRLVLKHWGEGNVAMAKEKPVLAKSVFHDAQKSEFAICEFEFEPGEVTLINLSATPESNGQVISIPGAIEPEGLPDCNGVRAVFKPARQSDVCDLLDSYAIAGGSHHLVMTRNNVEGLLEKLTILTGWDYIQL